MRLTKRRRTTRPRFNMTPMIDIVFLLIIFFMTVSQVSEINRENLNLPQQQGAEDQKPSVLTVNVKEDSSMVVAGSEYTLSELIALVANELTRLGDDPTRLTVVMRVDRRAESRTVSEVVEALASLDIRKVRFPVEVPK